MKLILCLHCHDVRKLEKGPVTTCRCGRSFGLVAEDGLNAQYGGDAIPLGFCNSTLVTAIKCRPEEGQGSRFEAFVIPKKCPTCKKIKEKPHGKT